VVARYVELVICADPQICRGQLSFRGTRIPVSDVLELVADEVSWDDIIFSFEARSALHRLLAFCGGM
jgi:uncharacterized protein (DUF433 family)